jgi:hypothetical protein
VARARRSIIYDEIGDRLGRGRHGGRQEVHTPDGMSQNLKRIALERAKLLVVNRHWEEVRKIFDNEIAFLAEVDRWIGGGLDQLDNPGMLAATVSYYQTHGMKRPAALTEPTVTQVGEPAINGAVEAELPLEGPDGRELFHGKPRPRKRVEVSSSRQIVEKST